MKIGTKGVPPYQMQMLQAARGSSSAREVLEHLSRIARDSDIRQGSEILHEGWIDLYDAKRDVISSAGPQEIVDRVESFFTEISPYDKALGQLDPTKLDITFVLGAGASKPAPSNIPTVKELLPQLLERARRLDREDVAKLADFCDEREIDNIEDLLTAAQLATFCSRSPTVLRLLNYLLYRRDTGGQEEEWMQYTDPWSVRRRMAHPGMNPSADVSSVAFLQDTLQVLFGLLASTMLPARPNKAHESIAAHTAAKPGSAIVTTNYDCCMDLALEEKKHAFDYGIGFGNRTLHHEENEACTRLLKLHGSLNWYYCETCQEVQLVDIRSLLKHYADDTSPYPVIGICKACGGQRRALLVPPLAMKFDVAPPLTPLLEDARSTFESADLILVLGFSFAEADVYISRMLSKSMQTKMTQRLLIVDPSHDVVSRLRKKFKASIPGFDDNRIVRLAGDCATLLPEFLEGRLKKSQSASRDASETASQRRRKKPTKMVEQEN